MSSSNVHTLTENNNKQTLVLKLRTPDCLQKQKDELIETIKDLVGSSETRNDIVNGLKDLFISKNKDDSIYKENLKIIQDEGKHILDLANILFINKEDKEFIINIVKENVFVNQYLTYALVKIHEQDKIIARYEKEREENDIYIQQQTQQVMDGWYQLKKVRKQNNIILNKQEIEVERNLFKYKK